MVSLSRTHSRRQPEAHPEQVRVALTTLKRDGEQAVRIRGVGFQGLAVTAPTEDEAKRLAEEVLTSLRRARGKSSDFQTVYVSP
jgi:hypothetical protein